MKMCELILPYFSSQSKLKTNENLMICASRKYISIHFACTATVISYKCICSEMNSVNVNCKKIIRKIHSCDFFLSSNAKFSGLYEFFVKTVISWIRRIHFCCSCRKNSMVPLEDENHSNVKRKCLARNELTECVISQYFIILSDKSTIISVGTLAYNTARLAEPFYISSRTYARK